MKVTPVNKVDMYKEYPYTHPKNTIKTVNELIIANGSIVPSTIVKLSDEYYELVNKNES